MWRKSSLRAAVAAALPFVSALVAAVIIGAVALRADVALAVERAAPEIGAEAPWARPKAVKVKKKARKSHRKVRREVRVADDSSAAVVALRSASSDALIAHAKAEIGKRGPQLGLPPHLWCADFINHLMRSLGLAGSGSRLARSFLWSPHFEKVQEPRVGDIVVVARGRSKTFGHVALFNGRCGKGGIRMLGGNQRGRRVTDDCVYGARVVGYVRPRAIGEAAS